MSVDPRECLLDESRLADAWLADDSGELTAPTGQRTIPCVHDLRQLPFTTDEAGIMRTLFDSVNRRERIGGDRLGLALQLEQPLLTDLDRVSDEHKCSPPISDDVQWGEETFLNLVESTALLSTGAPLLLLCMARPELRDRRPGWPVILRLEPLPEKEAGELVGELVGEAIPHQVRQRIIRGAGGSRARRNDGQGRSPGTVFGG